MDQYNWSMAKPAYEEGTLLCTTKLKLHSRDYSLYICTAGHNKSMAMFTVY